MNGLLGLQPWEYWELEDILLEARNKDKQWQDDEFSELTDDEFVLIHIR